MGCLCKYTLVYTPVYTPYISLPIYTHTPVYINTHIYINTPVYTYIWGERNFFINIYKYVHIYLYVPSYVSIYIYTSFLPLVIYIYAYVHMCLREGVKTKLHAQSLLHSAMQPLVRCWQSHRASSHHGAGDRTQTQHPTASHYLEGRAQQSMDADGTVSAKEGNVSRR